MSDTAPKVKLAPFHFVSRASVPWWKSGNKDFQEDIVPMPYRQPPTGVLDRGERLETNEERENKNRIKR